MNNDLKTAIKTINDKANKYTDLFNYYDGEQPITYSTAKLRDVFKSIDVKFTENWCAVVIDAVKERINLKGFSHPDEGTTALLDQLMISGDLINEADEAHEAALVTGEAYIIVWPEVDADGNEQGSTEIYYNDPRNVHLFYDPSHPKIKSYGAKMWKGKDEKYHVTLYYADRLEYYISSSKAEETVDILTTQFIPDVSLAEGVILDKNGDIADGKWPDNEYGEIPVFHFRMKKRKTLGDLANVISPQDAVNKLLADLMVSADFGAFAQRWVISNADKLNLKNSPNEIWNIPAGAVGDQATSVGQFTATDLANYIKPMETLASAIGSITGTPKHYFFAESGNAPSGEALIAMEAPLNKKAQDRIDRFTPVWREIAAFYLKIQNKAVDPVTITPKFSRPETVQPQTQNEIFASEINSGIPLQLAAKRNGWTEAEIDELMALKGEEAKATQAKLSNAYLDALKKFNGGQVV